MDPLVCPRCRGTLKVTAVIERQEIVGPILAYLGVLASEGGSRPPPRITIRSVALSGTGLREWAYVPVFDDLLFADPAS